MILLLTQIIRRIRPRTPERLHTDDEEQRSNNDPEWEQQEQR